MSDLISFSNNVVTVQPSLPCLLGATITGPSGFFLQIVQQLPVSGVYNIPINGLQSGSYTLKAAFNRSTYNYIGAIGNSGDSEKGAFDHTPIYIGQIAIDSNENVYSINNWDEAGADFKKWNKDGNSIYDAQFRIRNGNPPSLGYAITVDDKYIYVSTYQSNLPGQLPQYIQRFNISDGSNAPFSINNGHIKVYDNTPNTYPLKGLLSYQNTLYVSDSLGNRILQYDQTGKQVGQINIDSPFGLSIGADNTIYIACGTKISSYKNGIIQDVITGLKDCELIYITSNSILYSVEGSLIKRYTLHNGRFVFRYSFDTKLDVNGIVATDKHIYVSLNENGKYAYAGTGSRLIKYSLDFKQVWFKYGNEFASTGNYYQDDPSVFYSTTQHIYSIDNKTGQSKFKVFGFKGNVYYHQQNGGGNVRIIKLGNNKFLYTSSGDGVQIYKIIGHETKLVSLVGGEQPLPNGTRLPDGNYNAGKWTWNDIRNDGIVNDIDIKGNFAVSNREMPWLSNLFCDNEGNIWFTSWAPYGVYCLPIGPLDNNGNPTYDWTNLQQVISTDLSDIKFRIGITLNGEDGTLYCGGQTKDLTYNGNPFWMGFPVLARINKNTQEILWWVKLPEICTSMDIIPNGKGILVGGGGSSIIYHYNEDGLLIGSVNPPAKHGWIDNQGCISVNRNPQDNGIDVFVQDDFISRIIWYRIFENINISTLQITI